MNLPLGLEVSQSYLVNKSIKIKHLGDGNITLNAWYNDKNKLDKIVQIIFLIPNLLHFLDVASLSLLYTKFMKTSINYLFFFIHNCFAISPYSADDVKLC